MRRFVLWLFLLSLLGCEPVVPGTDASLNEPPLVADASQQSERILPDTPPQEPSGPDMSFPRHKPWNMAHRGGAKLYPANTLIAFQSAIKEHNVDVLEMDVHQTKDGVVVLQHDAVMDTTTDCKGKVLELTLEEYQKCNTIAKFKPASGIANRFVGQHIPHATLEEIFKAFPTHLINVEIKQYSPSMVAPLLALINKYKRSANVIVASTSGPTLQALRKGNPSIRTNLSVEELLLFIRARKDPAVWDEYQPPGFAIQAPLHMVDAEFVEDAHRKGMEVHPWTVNDEATMKKLLTMGVDGIITDRPDLLALLLKQYTNP